MRFVFRSRMLLLGFAVVAAAGLLMAVMGRGAPRVVYEAEVPEWRWSGASFSDQYLALLLHETDLRAARAALPAHVWRQAGSELEEWLADGDTAVVAAYLGEASTGGFAIRVRRVEVDETRTGSSGTEPIVTVTIARRRPTPDEFVTQAFTYPYEMVPIRRELLPEEPFAVLFVDDDGNPLNGDATSPVLRGVKRRPQS